MAPYLLFLALLTALLIGCQRVWGAVDVEKLKPSEIAIMQYDSREPSDYWLASAKWNNQYCKDHGHVFIYYTTKEGCRHGTEKLATPWCKVKAMIAANEDFPDVKLFIYMDSDAVIDKRFSDQPLNALMKIMQEKVAWDPEKKPIVFNQDGSCWWCDLVTRVGYTMCLNAGTVVWYRHSISADVLKQWWDASMDSYETNPIKRRFRLKWPWEQDRQQAVYNRSSHLIQIASQPERVHIQSRLGFKDWCLSHLPEAGCFVSHYCANARSKQVMKNLYAVGPGAGQEDQLIVMPSDRGAEGDGPSADYDFKVSYLTFE